MAIKEIKKLINFTLLITSVMRIKFEKIEF